MRAETNRNLLIAALLTIALHFVPYAGLLTYPIRLFVTFIHEGCHALAAVLTGGIVTGLQVFADGSGETLARGGFLPLIASAGYLGATLFGSLLLLLMRRGVSPRLLLGVSGGAVAIMTFMTIFGRGSIFGIGFWAGLVIATALIAGARLLSTIWASRVVSFLGIQCVLNALFDLRTLFVLSASTTTHTDAMNMQRATWIPAIVWASLWIVTSLVMLWTLVVVPALRDARRGRSSAIAGR